VRLDDAGIDALVLARLESNATYLAGPHAFGADFDAWPGDAQLAASSMAWAVGAGWPGKFPHLADCCKRQAWAEAAGCCDIHVGQPGEPGFNPGVRPRNDANKIAFANAAAVVAFGMDPAPVHWPAFPSPPDAPAVA
jgi:hypothetical protein